MLQEILSLVIQIKKNPFLKQPQQDNFTLVWVSSDLLSRNPRWTSSLLLRR